MIIPVEIITPATWKGQVTYRLTVPLAIGDLVVPAGFVTDGATVPRLFHFLFPPVAEYFAAAVAHDYALQSGADWNQALRIFKNALIATRVKRWRIRIMVGAVRMYGIIR